jgi:hypothetical protein
MDEWMNNGKKEMTGEISSFHGATSQKSSFSLRACVKKAILGVP